MIPVAGQQVGPYEILGRLGSGGMGLVYSAWDGRLQRDVAIKILREEFVRGNSRQRFLTEARAASGLNHPNICTVFDIGEQDGDPYLVMELLKGETLRARITAGPMSPEEILCAAIEIADALSVAHARGIIHRDIKPANIFLVTKPNGGLQTKVLDFGLAKFDLADPLDPLYQMTGQGSAVGTVAYMSPEQARGEALDARSDLFALGIVLHEMATGNVPFDGATSALIFIQLLGHAAEPLRQLNSEIPKDLERIVLKLLEKDRSARFQSAAELLDALRKVDLQKSSARKLGWFSKSPSRPSRKSSEPPDSAASLTRTIAAEKPPSSHPSSDSSANALTLRPVRREPLPPSSLPAAGTHWTRPPQPSPTPDSHPTSAPISSDVSALSEVSTPLLAPEAETPATTRWWIWASLGAAAVIAPLLVAVHSAGKPKATAPPHPETLLLASITNHSGDKTLDSVVLEGLRLDLQQSPHLSLPDVTSTAASAQSVGLTAFEPASATELRRAAIAAGATSVLSGELRNEAGRYIISIQVDNVATGATVLQAEESTARREQIADAIDLLATQIRIGLGESGDVVNTTAVPLVADATSNIEALVAYANGLSADAAGRPLDAIAAWQRAVAMEPKFTQAWLRLAGIYQDQHAEIAAADAATHAQDVSISAGDRTRLLARVSFEHHATADYPQALKLLDQLIADDPQDLSLNAQRALLLRLCGKSSDALKAAQTALARDPYNRAAAAQAEFAQLALGHTEAASRLEAQVEGRGHRQPGLRALLAFLDPSSPQAAAPDAAAGRLGAQAFRAQILDASGQLPSGLVAWRSIATSAQSNPALASAASYALAQAALDHALASDCMAATALAHEASALPQGPNAIFSTGMAEGLCGDLDGVHTAISALILRYPVSFAVKNYYLPDLTAIDQLGSGDPGAALITLQSAQPYDLLSLTPYLRGLAHSTAKQWPMATADFQLILLHRAATALTNPTVLPMAQLGLARAYAASGDKHEAATAYGAFLQMRRSPDALAAEAGKHLN